jgi:hypothetical protein
VIGTGTSSAGPYFSEDLTTCRAAGMLRRMR